MNTTNINTGVNSLPNRIKFAGCLEIDVNGEYVKDITTPRSTAKTIWEAAIKAAKEGVKVDGVNEIAICVHLNGLYIGTVFATKEGRKINVTPDVCQSAVNFLVNGIKEEKQATPTTPETETAPAFTIEEKGIGGCCDKYNVDALQMNGVNIAFRFTRWDDASRKYYTVPVSVKNQAALMADFPGLNIEEDEPGAVLLRGCDDETAAKVGYYAAVLDGELQETTATDTTDNAPKFEELTHAATNIVLTAENDGDIYRRYVEQLVNSLTKKVTRGVQLNASTLASSGAVANIIRESIKGMKSSGWTDPVTASDRKQAAAYLASVYISDAIENAEYING